MDATTFVNALKIMRAIDMPDFRQWGLPDWTMFRDHPETWMIEASDVSRRKLWGIMVNRDPRLAESTLARLFASRIADTLDQADNALTDRAVLGERAITLLREIAGDYDGKHRDVKPTGLSQSRIALQGVLDKEFDVGERMSIDADTIIVELHRRGFTIVPLIILNDDGHGRGEVREAVLSPRARQAALRALEKEFKTWRNARGLKPADGDAEDVRYHPNLSEIDRQWLDNFAQRWDAASCGEVVSTKVQP